MEWTSGVAARLTALSLDLKGRPTKQLLAADAVRCGLLVDLAFAGRLTQTRDSVQIDTTPTGFPPADRLLAAMTVEPERSLDGWLGERRLGVHEVIDALIATGSWAEDRTALGRRRYAVVDQTRVDRDKQLDVTDPQFTWTREEAAVAALGTVAHLVGRFRQLGYVVATPDISAEVFRAAEDHAWVLAAGVDYLHVRKYRNLYRKSALGFGGNAK